MKPRRKLWSTFWLVLRDLRIWTISTFSPEYFNKSIKQRRGKCPKSCGACCEYVGCEHFDKKTKKCLNYKNRRQDCRDFPFDRWDQWVYKRINPKAKCNFRWV